MPKKNRKKTKVTNKNQSVITKDKNAQSSKIEQPMAAKTGESIPAKKYEAKTIVIRIKAAIKLFVNHFNKFLLSVSCQIIYFGIIAAICLFISNYFSYPTLKVNVKDDIPHPPDLITYEITIQNDSKQDIYNFEFSFYFDGKHPIKSYEFDEINFKSNLMLVSWEDYSITRVLNQKELINPESFLMGGMRGSVDKFTADKTVRITVKLDATYDGSRGTPFPTGLEPRLPPLSYYLKYNYRPFGFTIERFFKKEFFFDFKNNQLPN